MMYRVLLFAVLRDAAGRDALEIHHEHDEIPLAELLGLCAEECPALSKYLQHVRAAVDLEYVGADARVRSGQEIALIPPVAGGAF